MNPYLKRKANSGGGYRKPIEESKSTCTYSVQSAILTFAGGRHLELELADTTRVSGLI